jgi:hypothetical protein
VAKVHQGCRDIDKQCIMKYFTAIAQEDSLNGACIQIAKSDSLVVQPVASRYTDCAIPALQVQISARGTAIVRAASRFPHYHPDCRDSVKN